MDDGTYCRFRFGQFPEQVVSTLLDLHTSRLQKSALDSGKVTCCHFSCRLKGGASVIPEAINQAIYQQRAEKKPPFSE